MDDIRQRDLSQKRVQDMTADERQELRRRFYEFVDLMQQSRPSRKGKPEKPPAPARKWDPAAAAKAKAKHA